MNRSFATICSLVGLLLAIPSLPAQVRTQPTSGTTSPRPHREAFAKTWGASKMPDRILLTWAEAPDTTQSVTWRTDATVTTPMVEWAVATGGPGFRNSSRILKAETAPFRSNLGLAHIHSATIRNLKPATGYLYRVGDGANWSEWSPFRTAASGPAPFSFLYFGDAQNDIKSHWSRVVREAFKEAPRAAFLLHAGDLVNRGNVDQDWAEWFYGAGWIFRTMPSIATPGNHEYSGGSLSRHWRPNFTLPKNGPKGCEETAYRIEYQGACIVSLDSNRNLELQAAWFEAQMRSTKARWKIVTMHHPVFSTAKSRDNPKLRNLLQPLFDRYKVDIVLQGHDHTYSRTKQMRHTHEGVKHVPVASMEEGNGQAKGKPTKNVATGVRARSGESGTVYVVSVSGPKMYALAKKPFMVKALTNTQLYQVVTVERDKMIYSAYTATGVLFDRFELRKKDGKPNTLVELKPAPR